MGLGKSAVSYIVLCSGLTGTATALLLELGSALYLYPLIVQGKPVNITTIPAFFPVIFELTVLFSAFGAVFGMLAMNLLPRWNHPLFNWDRFRGKSHRRRFLRGGRGERPAFLREGHARFSGQPGRDEHHRRVRRAVPAISYEILLFLAFFTIILVVLIVAGPRGRHTPGRPLEFFPDMVRPEQGQAAVSRGQVLRGRRRPRAARWKVPCRWASRCPQKTASSEIAAVSAGQAPAEQPQDALHGGPGLLRHRQDRRPVGHGHPD